MSVVIIGGHDRMVCQYKKICKEHKCKAKVFTHMCSSLSNQIGTPDLVILFTNTVSHKMVKCALTEANKTNAEIVRSHTSSGTALNNILKVEEHKSHATALGIIVFLTTSSSAIYIINGTYDLKLTFKVAIGSVIGGIIGAKLLNRCSGKFLRIFFGSVMIIAALRMVF